METTRTCEPLTQLKQILDKTQTKQCKIKETKILFFVFKLRNNALKTTYLRAREEIPPVRNQA